MKLTLFLAIAGLACSAWAAPAIQSSLLKSLQEKGTTTILISFKHDNTDSIRKSLVFPQSSTQADRSTAIYTALKGHADETQANVLQMLSKARSAEGSQVVQLWITNQIAVKKANLQLVQDLLAIEDIAEIIEDTIEPMHTPVEEIDHPEGFVPQAGEQWGVAAIEAPAVWATGNRGAGVLVGSIDTGVRYTHEALRDGYRSFHGWYDPTTGHQTPEDDNGHGTHTMGTIVGRTNGVGVAPEATWISCKACGDAGCPRTDLIACGQWAICPTEADGRTDPRCDLGPKVVSNSWGGTQEDKWYDGVIQAWIDAGIVPLFSAGNSGPSCGSANSPADSTIAIAVGSTDSTNKLSSFSSVGPTAREGRMKPDISAPGSSVVSSVPNSDTSYGTKSGTSMACPHAAGLTALLFSQRPNLTVAEAKRLLIAGSQPTVSTGRNCGGVNENTYPNHHVGAGRISAKASVEATKNLK